MPVPHNLLGSTGKSVSRLGFGCMRLPQTAEGRIDVPQTEELFRVALENGINYFDTAYMYHNGESEGVVGRILSRYDRADYYVTTKLPLSFIETMEDAKRIFAEQQTRLGMEHIDQYFLHNVSDESWKKVKKLGLDDYIRELKAAGKLGHIGFSFHGSYGVFEEVLGDGAWDLCQIQYNYMDEEVQAGTRGYELCKKLGIPVAVMEPIRGGALAKLSADLEEKLQAAAPGKSTASWALRWVAEHDNVKVILSGMSNMEQLLDNIATFSALEPFSETERSVLNEVRDTMKERRANGCTGCRYCMPCPNGVDIPRTFKLWNTYYSYRNFASVASDWTRFFPAEQKPEQCIGCGQCEPLCPQSLSIRDDLARAQKELDEKIW